MAGVEEANLKDQVVCLELAGPQCTSAKAIVKCLVHGAAYQADSQSSEVPRVVFWVTFPGS